MASSMANHHQSNNYRINFVNGIGCQAARKLRVLMVAEAIIED